MNVNGTLVEDKMPRFKGECAYFSFKKCSIYTHDDARAKFSTNSHETDNSVVLTEMLHYVSLRHGLINFTDIKAFVRFSLKRVPALICFPADKFCPVRTQLFSWGGVYSRFW